MRVRSAISAVVFAAVLALPGAAFAASSNATYTPPTYSNGASSTTRTTTSTITYNLDWTLPTAGKSGCMVCHGDKNLVRIINGKTVSLYVDTVILQNSAHANVPCTQCHIDFAYKTPHETIIKNGDDWRNIAKLSCKTCHDAAFLAYSNGAHSPARTPGQTSTVGAPDSSAPGMPRPLCGDCHGGHAIPSKNDTSALDAVHASAMEMCGKCHTKAATDYNDYYHGAAYRRGAPDAPACWQCHDTHNVLPSSNRNSWTNPDHLADTCSACHKSVNGSDKFVQYAQLVHKQQEAVAQNPLVEIANSARLAISNAVDRFMSIFKRSQS